MSKKKLVFVVLSLIFICALILIGLDFSSKTSFPGQKKENVEQIEVDSLSQEEDKH